MADVTLILSAIQQGDPVATDQLLPIVYDELRQLAAQKLAHERPGQTLTATALVHEAYLRLVGSSVEAQWETRGHFFAAASEAMRRILVDRARQKKAARRGGDRQREALDRITLSVEPPTHDLLALDDALENLSKHDHRKAELVKLRFFSGLTNQQAAELLGISTATAERDWTYARAWLHQAIVAGNDA